MSEELVLSNRFDVPFLLDNIDSRLLYVERLTQRILTVVETERKPDVKTHHWIITALVLIAVYLIGVKYPSLGQSALSKVGL